MKVWKYIDYVTIYLSIDAHTWGLNIQAVDVLLISGYYMHTFKMVSVTGGLCYLSIFSVHFYKFPCRILSPELNPHVFTSDTRIQW